ncbi:hypothetical protein D347_02172 [Enterococcus faecalis LA3B-2]|nr:hypothetical protein D347_02172 [Enterococcus faecalis LA3B-2]
MLNSKQQILAILLKLESLFNKQVFDLLLPKNKKRKYPLFKFKYSYISKQSIALLILNQYV